jgi:hypothetical protein
MLRVRRAGQVRRDFIQIARFWATANPDLAPDVFAAIDARIRWIAADHYLLGSRIAGLGPEFRVTLERRFGYKIYYRIEGSPPSMLALIAVRHGRQRPMRPATLSRYSRT